MHISLLALFSLLLAACATQAPPMPAESSFVRMSPITIDAGQINITEEYTPPLARPNIEHLFRRTPAEGVRQWVRDRIRTVPGSPNTLEVIIKDASVVEAALPKTAGLKGVFTKDQSERYDGRLAVELRIYAPGEAMSKASVTAEATQSRTVAENASVATRDAVLNTLNAELLNALNIELERNIRQYFVRYLR